MYTKSNVKLALHSRVSCAECKLHKTLIQATAALRARKCKLPVSCIKLSATLARGVRRVQTAALNSNMGAAAPAALRAHRCNPPLSCTKLQGLQTLAMHVPMSPPRCVRAGASRQSAAQNSYAFKCMQCVRRRACCAMCAAQRARMCKQHISQQTLQLTHALSHIDQAALACHTDSACLACRAGGC